MENLRPFTRASIFDLVRPFIDATRAAKAIAIPASTDIGGGGAATILIARKRKTWKTADKGKVRGV